MAAIGNHERFCKEITATTVLASSGQNNSKLLLLFQHQTENELIYWLQ